MDQLRDRRLFEKGLCCMKLIFSPTCERTFSLLKALGISFCRCCVRCIATSKSAETLGTVRKHDIFTCFYDIKSENTVKVCEMARNQPGCGSYTKFLVNARGKGNFIKIITVAL